MASFSARKVCWTGPSTGLGEEQEEERDQKDARSYRAPAELVSWNSHISVSEFDAFLLHDDSQHITTTCDSNTSRNSNGSAD